MTRSLLLALALASGAAVAQDAALPNASVPALDLQRYGGQWHEIAHLPMFFQRKCVANITATYTPLEDGRLRVVNACRKADGTRQSVEGMARRSGERAAELEVRFAPAWLSFLPFVWADYWVIAVDRDYQWAIVGEPDRDYLWFLTREPTVDAATFEALKARARSMGYKLDDLVVVNPPR